MKKMLLIFMSCICLAGCGQYGALYLPQKEQAKNTEKSMPDNAPDIAIQPHHETKS